MTIVSLAPTATVRWLLAQRKRAARGYRLSMLEMVCRAQNSMALHHWVQR